MPQLKVLAVAGELIRGPARSLWSFGGNGVSISEVRWEGSVLCPSGPRGIIVPEPPASPSSPLCVASTLRLFSALLISHATPSKEHSVTRVEQATVAAGAAVERCAVAGDMAPGDWLPGSCETGDGSDVELRPSDDDEGGLETRAGVDMGFSRALFQALLARLAMAASLALSAIPAPWLSRPASPLTSLLAVLSYPLVLSGPGTARQAKSLALP